MTRPTVTLVVPTYRRPDMLRRCLYALAALDHTPDRIVVVVRDVDAESRRVIEEWADPTPTFDSLVVETPGQVAALSAGLTAVTTEIVAFLDDDALPHPDWLGRVLDHFAADALVGGVGGRDDVQKHVEGGWGERRTVGVITPYGKVIGEHHRGVGPPRRVQILKGANMAYRMSALGDRAPGTGLGGGGAEPDNDLELALAVWAAGWHLIYDPAAVVDHHVVTKETARSRQLQERAPGDSWQAAYNRGLSLFRHLPLRRRLATMSYHLAVGTPLAPGLVTAIRYRRDGNSNVRTHFTATIRGFLAGARAGRREPAPAAPPTDGDERLGIALVAHDVGGVGGMERALGQLVVQGSDRIRFTVVAKSVDPEIRHLVDWKRVPVPSSPFAITFVLFALIGSFRAWRTGLPLHTYGAIVGNKADICTVQFCHQGFVEATGTLAPTTAPPVRRAHHVLVRLLSLAMERWCFRPRITRHYVAVSERVASELERHYEAAPITLAHNGVDVEEFHPDAQVRQRVRSELAVDESRTVILFVGGDWDRKGLPTLLEAFERADPIARDLELWVVGDGDSDHLVAGRRPEIAERVRCFGVQRDVAPYYQASDMFSLPTHYETFAIVAFEAAATGLPVIVSDTGALHEIPAADGGFLIEIAPEPIQAAIEQLADDPELRSTMGANARVCARQRTWVKHVDATISAYHRALEDRAG